MYRDVYDAGDVTGFFAGDARDYVRARAGIGNLWDDFVDAASDAADAVGGAVKGALDVVSDITDKLKDIPGISDVWGLVNDFARTDLGRAFLSWASPMLVPVLWVVPFVGPVIAASAYALPGIARGERADKAFAAEMVQIASRVGEEVFKKQVPEAIDHAKIALDEQGAKYLDGMNPAQFAEYVRQRTNGAVNIREDIGAAAVNGVLGREPTGDVFDPATGAWIPRKEKLITDPRLLGVLDPTVQKRFAGGDVAKWLTGGGSTGATADTVRLVAPAPRAAALTTGETAAAVLGVAGVLGIGAFVAYRKGMFR